jgi:RsiW-degrading membrane proteinase PrsW (M82 family)
MALLGALFLLVPCSCRGLVHWLDRCEKEPKLCSARHSCGRGDAGGGAYILNTAFGIGIYVLTGSEGAAEFGTTSIVAPIIEEGLKGLAVLAVFVMFLREFDSFLDGVVYGAISAMGFAAIENVLYLYRNGFLEAAGRALDSGLHPRTPRRLDAPILYRIHGIGLAIAHVAACS